MVQQQKDRLDDMMDVFNDISAINQEMDHQQNEINSIIKSNVQDILGKQIILQIVL